ncbi:hypothetical protein JQ634_02490 [Bradyrhizobium sp. AUGA SZCCT0240]|uniref:hypothetical protein n=1 Tax=Bradyrhizobium sp. AUGA SZCCT0240 TaxID=2807669 RepID=UPI001BA6C7FD|nr:hypothetical protein [Bradyrhizobium sp. AUGA SZCCT0240]MBR1252565.1 hypothetical protein [Bradyrhizobium sp. AUGA SZCCT0240]
MTKIFLHGDGNSPVSAWLEAAQDQPPFNVTTFKLKFSGETGALVLGSPFLIDAMLVRDAGGSDKRLVTWQEAVELANGEAKRLAAIALNELHDRLRSLRLKTDGTTQDGVVADFLGTTGVADVATSFDLELNPAGLLGDTNSKEPVFRARATAVFSAGFDSPFAVAGLDAAVHIEVQLTRANVLEALPRIEVPALPHLGLHFPHIPLPKWSLHGLKIPFPDLPLLRLPPLPHLDIVVEWDPKPNLDLSVAGNKLTLSSTKSKATVKFSGTEILIAKDVEIAITGNKVSITTANISTGTAEQTLAKIDLLDKTNPFVVTAFGVKVSATASFSQVAGLTVVVTIKVERLVISASTDPNLVLAVSPELELTFAGDKLTPKLTKLDLVEPYPIKLALFAAHVIEDGAKRLMSLIHKFEVPKQDLPGTPDLPSLDGFLKVLRRVGELAASAAAWLAQQGAAGVRALAGLAEAAFKMIAELVSTLAEAIAKEAQTVAKYIIVEVRVDLGQWRIVQIVVTPSDPGASLKSFTREFLGFKLDFPYNLSPALVCDLDKGWLALALQPDSASSSKVTLSTDLWLGHENGPAEPVSGQTNGTADGPLMQLDVTPKDPKAAIALIVVDNGRVKFLQQLKTVPVSAQVPGQGPNGGVVVPVGHLVLAARWVELKNLDASAFDIDAKIDPDRILSLFRKPKADATPGGNLLDQFSQHVRVKASNKPVINLPTIRIPIDVEVKISDTRVDTKLDLVIDVYTLSMAIKGGKFEIKIDKNEINLLGLNGKFLTKDGGEPPVDFAPLFLDFSDGDPRLGLSEAAKIKLSYDKLSTSGSTLDFEVDSFIVSRDGIDLSAQVQSNPVTLAGVDMPFRFDKGQLAVKRSQIQTFGLAGHGNLPPALVGEAKASIELNFTQENGALALQAAKAVLDKSGDPLRCEGTQFTITVTKLGLKYVRQGQYHFYFTLTGSAEFRPSSNAFADGLLKNISALRIVLDEAPLASDPRVLMNHIEFQVTVEPPKRSTFFDLFSFELRGVGFHPASPAFGGTPAFSISGQVNFTDFGDIVTPRFDFHKLWVAPPERGKALPRVRFDGLGVGLSLGSMAEASGTAIAVDGKLPTLFQPDVLPADVTAKGFLASGSLRISGWASMSASMGFLQLEKAGVDEKRPAFFLYVQRNDMAEKIPTPIGTIYLREVGFGFGYRYTLAGIAAAERAETPKELVKILDEISKYQGSLYDVKAWWPTYDNAAITLALRGMFSFTSVSTTSSYNEEGEKNLPNLALFDIVVALRTDLTFLMNLRIWIAYNYADWREGRRNNSAWTNNPSLTGYMYLSVPRREFLARAVYNPGADIGDHPMLPAELKMAMKAVKWSSTLYIRPGLFHAEYGWPYELGFSLGKPNGNFFLSVEGGTVLRVEDLSVLYGLAFRARGFAAFAYDTGGDFGAAITARANFALGAKLIAYLSANISESMFYGVITLDLTLEFSVRMWLRTKWFSLSCGFSRSITIHIGVELLVQPGGLAARIEASISVGAFGRNLSLGIGFSLGSSGRLAEARVRVERFLALGLATSYPALGLTFVMRGDRVEELFGTKTKSSDSPITSETFTIKTRIPREPGPSIDPPPPGVVLFNPPDRMFRIMSPVLDQPELAITTKGVRATWDLEPAWKKSTSLYGDPEFHLKHYRVERRIEGLADSPLLKRRPAPMELTIKRSDHTAIVVLRDADGNLQLRKRRLREAKPLQFVDDFKDIDPGLRAALLPPVLLNSGDEIKQADDWKDVVKTASIIYAIVPVDCAGTRGQVDTHVVKFEPREAIPNNLLKATARFSYPSMPSVLQTPVLSSTFLALTVEEEEAPKSAEESKTDENAKPKLPDPQDYVLRVRTERTVAVGVFGADAISQARNEPPVPESLDPGVHELDLVLRKSAGGGQKIKIKRIARRLRARTTPGPLPEPAEVTTDYGISDSDWKKLLTTL